MDPFEKYVDRIESELAIVLPEHADPVWLSRVAGQQCPEASLSEADKFLEPGRDLLGRGGKRWRPLVTVLTCEALGGGRAADILSALTEIPHNGSLIVDDIEDSSLVRRGAPAVHLIHGTDLAINMGNLMYFLPTLVLENTQLDELTRWAVTRDWMAVMRRLHLGQGYDILWHRNRDFFPSVDAYLTMCGFKTGSLSSLAARLGVRAAAAATATNREMGSVEDIGSAWEALGIGFQILDDVDNLSAGVPGKDRGDDIVEGKKSLPAILHIASHPEDREKLAALFEAASELAPKGDWAPVEEAIDLMQNSGAIADAGVKAESLLSQGVSMIEALLPETPERTLLNELVKRFRRNR